MKVTKEQLDAQKAYQNYLNNLTANLSANSQVLSALVEYLSLSWRIDMPIKQDQMTLPTLCRREGIRECLIMIRSLIKQQQPKSAIIKPAIIKPGGK